MDTDNNLVYWLGFTLAEGLGPKSLRDIIGVYTRNASQPNDSQVTAATADAFAEFNIQELFLGPAQERRRRLKIALGEARGEKADKAIAEVLTTQAELIEHSQRWAQEPNNYILPIVHPLYPPRLKELPDAPLLLYVKGRLELLKQPSIAVVGSRTATVYGERLAEDFSAKLSATGIVVVSGLATGIDAAAHRGALGADIGGTMAVLGTGPNIIYPRQHKELARSIAEKGLIVTEYPLNLGPRAHHFPRRNRIIAGLSMGCLVVEASEKSGALITARLSAEMGREVFAIPGSVHSPLSHGPHRLLREGAKLVEKTQDILEEMHGQLIPYLARYRKELETMQQERAAREQEDKRVSDINNDKQVEDDLLTLDEGDDAALASFDEDFDEALPTALIESNVIQDGDKAYADLKSTNPKKKSAKTPRATVKNKTTAKIQKTPSPSQLPQGQAQGQAQGQNILAVIPYSPLLIDDIIALINRQSNPPTMTQIHEQLLMLEMDGWIESMAGGRFQRIR